MYTCRLLVGNMCMDGNSKPVVADLPSPLLTYFPTCTCSL
jgi:hypothetical protein